MSYPALLAGGSRLDPVLLIEPSPGSVPQQRRRVRLPELKDLLVLPEHFITEITVVLELRVQILFVQPLGGKVRADVFRAHAVEDLRREPKRVRGLSEIDVGVSVVVADLAEGVEVFGREVLRLVVHDGGSVRGEEARFHRDVMTRHWLFEFELFAFRLRHHFPLLRPIGMRCLRLVLRCLWVSFSDKRRYTATM